MGCVTRRRRSRGVIPLGCVLAALWASSAHAHGDLSVFGGDALQFSGDVRVVAVGGETSWVNGGFGKLRSGGNGSVPQVGNVSLVWKPQLSWSLGATVVGMIVGGQRPQAGVSEAYLSYRPMRSSTIAFSARAGLMWPPLSLEHEGSDWHVRDSITPSAINSWIGEEVKPLAAEGTVVTVAGRHKFRATAAMMTANDTAGTLLTFRGWALHDRVTLAFNRQPLPPLGEFAGLQAAYSHPLLDVHKGFGKRIGYYAKFTWQPPVPLRVEIFRYDNGADPEDVTSVGPEWGWRTRFNHLGVAADLGSGLQFKSQAIAGRTRMGFRAPARRWVDERFRSAYALIAHSSGKVTLAVRGDVFDTQARGSKWTHEYDEQGWAGMLSAKRDWKHVSALLELLHVWSNVPARRNTGAIERMPQTQFQAELRMHW